MKKILFVCHGNICRSVMAQYIFSDLVKKSGLEDQFFIDSAAVSSEETGNPIYPPARRKLAEKGIPVGNHRARKITQDDLERFDEIYLMDCGNLASLRRQFGFQKTARVSMLLDDQEIADPWYTDDFETAYNDLLKGCAIRLKELEETL